MVLFDAREMDLQTAVKVGYICLLLLFVLFCILLRRLDAWTVLIIISF